MKQKYPLYRQPLEFYVSLKLLTFFRSHPNKLVFTIPGLNNPYLVPLLDSVILTKKSLNSQILPTNSVFATIKLPDTKDVEIGNQELLGFESYYDIIEYVKQQLPNQEESSIQGLFTLVFSNTSGFLESLENNLKKYLHVFVDDKLHETNSCKFGYQVEVIRNKVVELSKTLNLNHITLNSKLVFDNCNCQTHFIEVIGSLFLSGLIELHQINFDLDTLQYITTIGMESPEKIDLNSVRSYFGLSPKTNLGPTFFGDNTYAYENGQLSLKLDNGSKVTFDLATKTMARCIFDTFYELRKSAPPDKEVFTSEEIVNKYNAMHEHYPIKLQTLRAGRIGELRSNCRAQMFKGDKAQYYDRIEWVHVEEPIKGYKFRIK